VNLSINTKLLAVSSFPDLRESIVGSDPPELLDSWHPHLPLRKDIQGQGTSHPQPPWVPPARFHSQPGPAVRPNSRGQCSQALAVACRRPGGSSCSAKEYGDRVEREFHVYELEAQASSGSCDVES